MIPLHTVWSIGPDSFAELIRRGLEVGVRSGAASDESGMPMLGDDLVPDPSAVRTLAEEAAVPLAAVRPWLAQMLRGGGVYGWPPLETSATRSATTLVPGLPPPAVGERCGDLLEIARIDDAREIVWRSQGPVCLLGNPIRAITFDYLLRPVAEDRTRMVARIRVDAPTLTRQVLLHLLDALELALIGSQIDRLCRCAEAAATATPAHP